MKPINIKGLQRYSLSKDGRVFLGEKEILGIWADPLTFHFALKPAFCKHYSKAFKLQTLYDATYQRDVPKSVTNRIYKTRPSQETSTKTR